MGGLSTIDSQNEFSRVSEGRKSVKSRKSFKNLKREEVQQIVHESPALNQLEDELHEPEDNSLDAFEDDEPFEDFADKFSKNEDLEYLRYNRVKSQNTDAQLSEAEIEKLNKLKAKSEIKKRASCTMPENTVYRDIEVKKDHRLTAEESSKYCSIIFVGPSGAGKSTLCG